MRILHGAEQVAAEVPELLVLPLRGLAHAFRQFLGGELDVVPVLTEKMQSPTHLRYMVAMSAETSSKSSGVTVVNETPGVVAGVAICKCKRSTTFSAYFRAGTV